MTIAVLGWALECPPCLVAQGEQQPAASTTATPETSGPQSSNLESQMQTMLDEVRQLREENRQLQQRVSDLEAESGGQVAAHLAKIVAAVPAPAAPHPAAQGTPRASAKTLVSEVPGLPTVQLF